MQSCDLEEKVPEPHINAIVKTAWSFAAAEYVGPASKDADFATHLQRHKALLSGHAWERTDAFSCDSERESQALAQMPASWAIGARAAFAAARSGAESFAAITSARLPVEALDAAQNDPDIADDVSRMMWPLNAPYTGDRYGRGNPGEPSFLRAQAQWSPRALLQETFASHGDARSKAVIMAAEVRFRSGAVCAFAHMMDARTQEGADSLVEEIRAGMCIRFE